MAPVVWALEESSRLDPVLISSGQHRELLDTALQPLGLAPDHDLDVMTENQTAGTVAARVIEGVSALIEEISPSALLVQGDTTTVLAAGLAAYYSRVPIGHVEAGLRTYDFEHPYPEEANRQLVDRLCNWCFAPTQLSCDQLVAEQISHDRVFQTGNTAVDAILRARELSEFRCKPETLLVTLHRRESFGRPLIDILDGVCDFLDATPDAHALWPVHPNPAVKAAIEEVGDRFARIELVDPMDYLSFAGAVATCRLIVSDSGGVQEEAPSLGKRVLVARETTERPEGLSKGLNQLVGRSRGGVRDALRETWAMPAYAGALPAPSPYGDGRAGHHIVKILENSLA